MPISIGGKTFYVPDAYGTVEVVNMGNVSLPSFNNILLIGSARKGLPCRITGRKSYEFIKSFSSISDAKDWFGTSDLTRAFEYAKAGGAGVIHVVNVAPLTNGLATVQDNAGIPANTFDVVPEDKYFGAAGNDISLTVATASSVTTFTIIPPKLTKFLTANASTSSAEITVEDVEGLVVGQTVKIWDNTAATLQSTTITAIDTTANKITLADMPTAAYATSGYARIFQEDIDRQEVKSFASTATATDVINWINTGNILIASRSTYVGVMPTSLTKKHLQLFTSATKGTSPVATETAGGSFDLFAASAGTYFDEFRNYTKARIRLLNVLSNAAAVHAVYKALATDLRTNMQYSVQIVTGCATGDVLLAEGGATHPIIRAKALNSDEVILAGMGIDGKAPYLSFAPYLAGWMSSNSVKRNLTADAVSATSIEKYFGQSNPDETARYLQAGVVILGTGPDGYYIVQGVNTWQNQATLWIEDGAHTYLIQQRQTVDFVFEGYRTQMKQGVGADDYNPTKASVQGLNILRTYADQGYITDYKMLKAWQDQNAVKTKPQITPLVPTDFVGFEMVVYMVV